MSKKSVKWMIFVLACMLAITMIPANGLAKEAAKGETYEKPAHIQEMIDNAVDYKSSSFGIADSYETDSGSLQFYPYYYSFQPGGGASVWHNGSRIYSHGLATANRNIHQINARVIMQRRCGDMVYHTVDERYVVGTNTNRVEATFSHSNPQPGCVYRTRTDMSFADGGEYFAHTEYSGAIVFRP